jgi:hypothetical protein
MTLNSRAGGDMNLTDRIKNLEGAEAVKEYEEWCDNNKEQVRDLPYGPLSLTKAHADAAIAQLLDMVEDMTRQRDAAVVFGTEFKTAWDELKAQHAAVTAERDRLRVCGSCRWCGSVEYLNCTHADVPVREMGEFYVSLDDSCHFTPSRWTERKASDE